ncbi:universal stress protein UspA [Ligilactobacillus pabuli]|uniref:Universal stress protein UspA n=1 Tax=Ligilactobacillus pabuli TaxID=2886039 RepID=A0ABQ5JIR9_9LACO|nr:universal stress protein [Ligilactobacillus pabuli]GKS81633.1 universal stress protein UspA [Ligilactobacillus pabuli]HIW89330.1 universal stress protein [Candidatus Ligilactobacillus excrementipullorum]
MAEREMKFHRVLVGVDDSHDALLAFYYAVRYAAENDAELFIVSVLESDDLNIYQALDDDYIHGERSQAEEHILDFKQQAYDSGVKKVTTLIAEGDAGKTIVKDVIPHVQPDLLVIGSFDKPGIARRFGSQAAYMSKYAPCSVLVIR